MTARWLGLAPAPSAEFSFLLSVPAIAGAVVLQAGEIQATGAYTTTYSAVNFNGFAPLKAYCI